MKIFLLSVEFILASILIVAILMHSAKGDGLGAIGSPAKMFSSQKGLESGLKRFTTIIATAFIIIALILSLLF